MADIRKSMGILIRDGKVVVTRSKGKKHFIGPGGKREENESDKETLARELYEELSITVAQSNMHEFGVFTAAAAGQSGKTVTAHVFLVEAWSGTIEANNEIDEVRWITSRIPPDMQLGSIFAHEILPRLKHSGMID